MNKNTKNYKKIAFIAVFIGLFAFLALGYAIAGSITPDSVINLVNQARSKAGLNALQENPKLAQAAADKAEDMLKNDYFAHNSPSGKTPWSWIDKSGYDYKYAGENLAMNFTSAEVEQKAWMNSPTHKKNILSSNYRDIGVAVAEGKIDGQATMVVVQMFGFTPVVPPANEKNSEKVLENNKQEVLGQEENKIIPRTVLNDPKYDILGDDFTVLAEKTDSSLVASPFWASIKGWLSDITKAEWMVHLDSVRLVPAALVTLWAIMIGSIFFLAYSLSRKFAAVGEKKDENANGQKIPVENLEEAEKEISVAVKTHILHAAK